MTEVVVGIKHVRDDIETLPVAGSEMSVVGIVGTAPLADADAFPLDTAVYGTTDDSVLMAKLGATGTIPDAVRGVTDQLAVGQHAARCIIVRVAEGVDADATIVNLVGEESAKTGIWELLEAPNVLGVTPRLIIVPGYTSQHTVTGGVVNVTSAVKPGGNTGNGVLNLANPAFGSSRKAGVYLVRCIGGAKAASSAAKAGGNTGTGTLGALTSDNDAVTGAWRVVCTTPQADGGVFAVYRPDGTFDGVAVVGVAYNSAHGVNFTLADGGTDFAAGDEFVVTVVDSVPANGGVFSVVDPDGVALANATVGAAYNGAHIKFTIADGATDFVVGDGFNVTVAITAAVAEANPVVAEIPTILDRLRAMMIADGPASGRQAWIDWRETIQSDRIIPLAVDSRVLDPVSGEIVVRPSSPRIAGIGVRRDHEFDGRPFHSWANQPVRGIVGPSRPIAFSLTDGAVEAQDLIGRNAGVIVRGESGVEDAIAEGGFVFWGTDTCAEDPLWMFYHVMRGRDYIELGQVRTLRFYLGRFNITTQAVRAVLNTMESHLGDLRARGDIIDFRVGFEVDKNSPEELRQGNLQVLFKAEEPPVLRKIVISSRRYREALENLTRTIATALNNLGA